MAGLHADRDQAVLIGQAIDVLHLMGSQALGGHHGEHPALEPVLLNHLIQPLLD